MCIRDRNLNVAEIKLENGDLNKGDLILITGPTTGVVEYVIGELRVDLKVAETALKGELCSIKAPDFLRRSDKVYKWVDSKEVNPLAADKKLSLIHISEPTRPY